jgi:hypothetical protein
MQYQVFMGAVEKQRLNSDVYFSFVIELKYI